MRWWDGQVWGPPLPSAGVSHATPLHQTDEQRGSALALFSHLGFAAGWFIPALVIRVAASADNPYVRHHSTEALNFQILFLVVWNALLFPIVFLGILDDGPTWIAFGLPLAAFACAIANVVLSIRGAIQAGRGVWWRYPVSLRLVRGARPNDSFE